MPPKRKAKDLEDDSNAEGPRRSTRRTIAGIKSEVARSKESNWLPAPKAAKIKQKAKKTAQTERKTIAKIEVEDENGTEAVGEEIPEQVKPEKSTTKSRKPTLVANTTSTDAPSGGRQYWLMKAEPESRLEHGHDIKFSIDDLAAKTEPEPWDGIRAYSARNNLRAMKKGDLAFFYHSSCKVPAIVGTMEIVKEHSPDLSAHNPKAPYYDPKSKPEDPKWSVVHVTFKQKLKTPVTLKELKAWQTTKGHALENMQMLKLARLSVSRVSEGEWEFLVGEMKKNGDVVEQ